MGSHTRKLNEINEQFDYRKWEEKTNNFVLEVKMSGHKFVTMAIINHERCSTIWWSVYICKISNNFVS